ncbi:uncharacterized protein LOC124856284 isoform X6 [Girardinichthys multiradiatus]|uniref:uncharacterized protein LOC124856284 isoform X6 n=1 Tax=Girardinichthys multiradiatus TaxID=208333 RepID=UPI001FACE8B1|nr:uncharacterized protein LOC124856284 isoform X6 [Girardinichthys multiradiatus]
MENVRLQGFKTFLTEHFTALAVEVFGEVESMMEACYEENKRLRSMLDMVLGPEINLHRIDVSLYKGTTTITRRQPLEPNPTSGLETSEPLCKRPKEEMIECEINLETEQQQWPGDVENFNIAMSIKDDPEEEEAGKATCITEAYREVTDQHSDSSATTSAYDNGSEREAWSVPEANEAARASLQVLNQDSMNVNQQTNPETTSTDPGAVTKKKKTGAATYNSKFNPKWEEEWSCITAGSTPFHFWCTVCRRELECRHSGRADVVRHFKRDYHIKKLQFYEKLFGSSLKLKMAVIPKTGEVDKLEAQTRRAEVKVAVTLVQHDIPLAFSDHLSPLFKHCFPDSRIASKYSSARTKTTAIINKCVAPYLMNEMARNLTKQPFSLAIEGSNNIGERGKEKMKPLTVKLWSPKGVVKNFLNMGVTAGASTPDSICRKINEALQSYFIPWTNCIALSVNDTKVDLASEKFRKIILLDQNPAVYVLGWPCHIVHDNARASSLMYYQESRFDVEDMCADLGLWFKSNTNHPDDFRVFCDTQYMELLQNVNIRWLRLELAVNHIMRLYKHLKTYFKSTDETQGRGVRLRMRFQDPMTEVHLLFYQALLPAFVEFNQIFQRQDPCVHLLHGQIRNFISMLMLKFLKPETFNETSPEKVGYKDEENQLSDSDLDPGLTTKAALTRLNETGEISLSDVSKFYKAARCFLHKATEFAVTKLPLNDTLLSHAVFLDFKKRRDCRLDDVLYFVQRYNHLLPYNETKEQDNIGDEFLDYQVMEECEIPPMVWKDALVRQGDDGVPCKEHHRMDIIWAFLSDVRSGITGTLRFPRLMKVAQLVLCLPHSNSDAERSFSLIGHNRTDTRNRLSLEGTLSAAMCIKMSNIEPCFKYEPPAEMVKNSKFAAVVSNKKQSAKEA